MFWSSEHTSHTLRLMALVVAESQHEWYYSLSIGQSDVNHHNFKPQSKTLFSLKTNLGN